MSILILIAATTWLSAALPMIVFAGIVVIDRISVGTQ